MCGVGAEEGGEPRGRDRLRLQSPPKAGHKVNSKRWVTPRELAVVQVKSGVAGCATTGAVQRQRPHCHGQPCVQTRVEAPLAPALT